MKINKINMYFIIKQVYKLFFIIFNFIIVFIFNFSEMLVNCKEISLKKLYKNDFNDIFFNISINCVNISILS